MAARKTPSKGSKPDKLMRDAILMELAEEVKIEAPVDPANPGKKRKIHVFKKLRLVARSLVNAAIAGDVPASREIIDRVDGKVTIKVGGDADSAPIKHEEVGEKVAKLPDLSKLSQDDLIALYRTKITTPA